MARLCLAAAASLALAGSVTITPRNSVVYASISPKLRIQSEGINPGDNVALEFVPPLTTRLNGLRASAREPIYKLNVTSNALVLGLKQGMTWPSFGHDADGTTLFLSSFKVNGGDNILEGPVPVARVIPAPSIVNGEDKLIYATGTTKFLINGTGFREGMALTFDPPLVKDVDYVMNVRSTTAVQLLLRTGRAWRAEPGPLKLRRVDVGGGALRIDPKAGGVIVAEVQADLGGHGVTVETTAADQFVYQSAKTLGVKGSGFDHVNTEPGFGPPKIRWANGIKGRGQNYTTVSFDANGVVLQRAAGSKWRAAGNKLPGPLIALACDAGSGFVGLGPTEAKKGVRVATVFEDPSVTKPEHPPALFKTHTAQLWLKGSGFVRAGQLVAGGYRCEGTVFTFEPALIPGEDILVTVFNRTHALVRLRQGKAWAKDAGTPLKVTAVQTGPMGPFPAFEPVVVAVVAPDDDHSSHASGATVERSNHQVLYQTPTLAYLTITGSALSAGCALTFDPPLSRGVDYDVVRATSTKMTLGLKTGRTWRREPGPLVLKSLVTAEGGDPLHLAHGTGIVVADVVADPTIQVSRAPVTATTTRRVSIRGAGFDLDGVVVQLEPTWASSFEVEQVFSDEIVLRLNENKAWTPSGGGVAYKIPPGGVPLTVTRLTTAAGDFVFKDATGRAAPVQVATIVEDVKTTSGETIVCDDSCAWALDGVCDDGSRPRGGGGGGIGGRAPGRRNGDDDYAMGDDEGYGYGYDYAYGPEGDEVYDDDGFLEGDGTYEYGDEYAYGYDYFYNEENAEDAYGYYGDDWGAPACAPGTDCSDCGGPLGPDGAPVSYGGALSQQLEDDTWFDDDESEWWDDDYDFGDEWSGFQDDADDPVGIIKSVKSDKKAHKRYSGDHTANHWFHARRQKHGKEGPTAELKKAGTAVLIAGLVAAVFVAWAYHTKLSDEDRADKCAPCKAALVVAFPDKDSAAFDEAEAALGIKSAKD